MKTYIENSDPLTKSLFQNYLGFDVVTSPDDAQLLVFTGGSDVSPYLYGDKQHQFTYNDAARDAKEERLFQFGRLSGKKMVGICRGGQFLNVMSGGRMFQHVSNHTRSHMLHVKGKEPFLVTSTHHQMMMPSKEGYILATGKELGFLEWYDQEVFRRQEHSLQDIEVVHYPHTHCLCFQPHPEYGQEDPAFSQMREYFKKLIEEVL